MPELPEVETTLRGIAPHILNQTVSAVTASPSCAGKSRLRCLKPCVGWWCANAAAVPNIC